MKILVTGARGFIGKNLIFALRRDAPQHTILEYNSDDSAEELEALCRQADFIFNIAGVNRPTEIAEFTTGNVELLERIISHLEACDNRCTIVQASSTQAALDNPYGISKRTAEQLLLEHEKRSGAKVVIYRLPNIFGRWCRPNYNSVVATFCYNIARDIDITINQPDRCMTLLHIDKVVAEFIAALSGLEQRAGDICTLPQGNTITVSELANTIQRFRRDEQKEIGSAFEQELYSTYCSMRDDE